MQNDEMHEPLPRWTGAKSWRPHCPGNLFERTVSAGLEIREDKMREEWRALGDDFRTFAVGSRECHGNSCWFNSVAAQGTPTPHRD